MQKKVIASINLEYVLPTPKMTVLQMTWRAGITPKIGAQLIMKYSIAALFSLMKPHSNYPPLVKLADEAKSEAIRVGEEAQTLDFQGYCNLVTKELQDIEGNLSSLNTPGNPLFEADQQLQLACFQDQLNSIPKHDLYALIANKLGLSAAQVEQRIVDGDWILPSVKSPTPMDSVSLNSPSCYPESSYVAKFQDELIELQGLLQAYSTEITQLTALNALVAPSSNILTLLAVNACLDFFVGFGVLSHAAHNQVLPKQAEQRLQVAFALTAVVAPWIAAGIEATLGLNYVSLPAYPSPEEAQQAASGLFEYQTETFRQANDTVTEKLSEFPQLQDYPTQEIVTPGSVVFKPTCGPDPCVTKQRIQDPSKFEVIQTLIFKSALPESKRPPSFSRGPEGGDVVQGVSAGLLRPYESVGYLVTINSTKTVVSVEVSQPARIVVSQLPPMPSENPNFVNTKPCVMKIQVAGSTLMVSKSDFDIRFIPKQNGTFQIMVDGVRQLSLPLPALPVEKVLVTLSLEDVMQPQLTYRDRDYKYNYDFNHDRNNGLYNLCVFKAEIDNTAANQGPSVAEEILLPTVQRQQPCAKLKVDPKLTLPTLKQVSNKQPPSRLKEVYPDSNYGAVAAHSAAQASSVLACAALMYALPVVGPTVMALQLVHNLTGNASTGPMAVASRGIRSVWNWRTQQAVLPLVESAPQMTEKAPQALDSISVVSQGV